MSRPEKSLSNIFRSLLTLACMSMAWMGYSQEWEKEGEGEIKDLEIEMTKERKLTLPRATRYFEKVPPRPYEPIVPAITYEFRNLSFTSPNYTPVIRPLRLKQEELTKLYGNYVSGGLGNYQSFFAEGSAATKRDKNKMIGADFYWRSFGKGPVEDGHSANSTTRVTVFGKKVTDAVTVSGDVNYYNNRVYFYGFTPGTDIDRDKLKQVYEITSVNVSLTNSKKEQFNYFARAGYSFLKDAYVSNEGEFSLTFKGNYAWDDKHMFQLDADMFLINRKDADSSLTRHLLHIRPSYTFRPLDGLAVTAGLNLAIQSDSFNGSSVLNGYPYLAGRYAASEKLTLYARVSGDVDKVNLHSLSAENPWMASDNAITNTNRLWEIDGGMEGTLGTMVATRVGAAYTSFRNLYFYQNVRDPLDPGGITVGQDFDKFGLTYDDATRFNPYAEATFTQADAFGLTLRADYYKYSTRTLANAWHRPSYRTTLQVKYNLYSKIFLQAGLIAQGGMKAIDPDPAIGQINLETAVDLNFRARYFFSKQISAFVQLDNMLSNQYPLYWRYPGRGFQALVGASWSF